MGDWVIRGDIEYNPERIVVTGEIAERIVDIWKGVQQEGQYLHGWNLTDHSGVTNHINVIQKWVRSTKNGDLVKKACGENFERVYTPFNSHAMKHGVMFNRDSPLMVYRGDRSIAHNAYQPFMGDLDFHSREFVVTIEKPLPPSYIDRMLKSYQWLLKVWDLLGDDNPKWIKGTQPRTSGNPFYW